MQAQATIDEQGRAVTSGVTGPVPWWSFSKTVLAIALIRLAEDGLIDLDRPMAGKPHTPAHLLAHEAGLPDYGGLAAYHAAVAADETPWSADEFARATEADRPLFAPGQGWAYSNLGYRAVADLMSDITGRPLAEALSSLVFAPLGLRTARLAETPDDLASVEMGDVRTYHPGWVHHGLIVGSLADAARILHALQTGRLVGAAMLARMMAGRPLPQFRSATHRDPAYGLGLMLSATDPLDHPSGHAGAGPGSRIAVYGVKGRIAAVWASEHSGLDPEAAVFSVLAGDIR